MKTFVSKSFAAASLAVFVSIPACMDPYAYGPGGATSSTTVTTYRPGYEVTTLPYGYRTETYGGTRYYTAGDTYYQSRGGRYVVVESPRGRTYSDAPRRDYERNSGESRDYVTVLPRGYRTTTVRGTQYYQAGGMYYRPEGQGYVVVREPY